MLRARRAGRRSVARGLACRPRPAEEQGLCLHRHRHRRDRRRGQRRHLHAGRHGRLPVAALRGSRRGSSKSSTHKPGRPPDDVSWADFIDLTVQQDVFERVAADDGMGFHMRVGDGPLEAVGGAMVTAALARHARREAAPRSRLPRGRLRRRTRAGRPACSHLLDSPIRLPIQPRSAAPSSSTMSRSPFRRAAAERAALRRRHGRAADGRGVSPSERASGSRCLRPAEARRHDRPGAGGARGGSPWSRARVPGTNGQRGLGRCRSENILSLDREARQGLLLMLGAVGLVLLWLQQRRRT